MKKLVAYFRENFEQSFVLLVLVSSIIINYFLPYKIAFLNFYYLPIMLLGYFLGKKMSMLGSILCILTVVVFAVMSPESFLLGRGSLDIALSLSTWGSFLLLAGVIVGTLQEKLSAQCEHANLLNEELKQSQVNLEKVNQNLTESNKILEEKTSELEITKETIEKLKDKVEEALYSTMDSSVAKLLIQGRLRNEKKNISVLFADLVGFTNFSDEHRPEAVIEELNKFLAEMESIIMHYWGHIDKYMGDGIMCEFGAPHDYDHHALQAVLAGLKMQERMQESKLPWQMRVGIGSGPCITGLIGQKRRTYTAIGDVINVAARLEQICPPQGLLIDEDTYQKIESFIDAERTRNFGQERKQDIEIVQRIKANEVILEKNPQDFALLVEIGKMYFELRNVSSAIRFFERAYALDPHNEEVKLLYADANFKRDEYEKIEIKGKKDRISVYRALGIKDILLDRKRIPERFYKKYKHVEDLIEIPDNVVLPVEALDGVIGHSKLVAIISYAMADVYGLTEQEKRNVLIAGYLEDIGKQIVPHAILNRRGSLLDSETKEIEKHPIESVKLMKSMGYDDDDVLEIVLHHHENFNGHGYPNRIGGEDIPIGARITAVADSYNALISWRPYRDGWEQKSALAEMVRDTEGGKFDPRFTEILMQLMA